MTKIYDPHDPSKSDQVDPLTHMTYCLLWTPEKNLLFSAHSASCQVNAATSMSWCGDVDLSALLSPGRNWAGADRPQPFSTRFASVYRFCVASLSKDLECEPEELKNGLDWCRPDRGGQRKTGTVDG